MVNHVEDGLIIHLNFNNIDGFGNNGKDLLDQGIRQATIKNLVQAYRTIEGTFNGIGYDATSGYGRESIGGVDHNYALFDGGDDYISLSNTSALNLSSITVQAIVSILTLEDYLNIFNSKSTDTFKGMYLGFNNAPNNNNLTGKIYKNPSPDNHINTTELSTATVYNLCITATSTTVNSYINGANNQSGGATGYNGNTDKNFTIGAPTSLVIYGNFKLYDIKVYNRALTAAQVLQNHNAGAILPYTKRTIRSNLYNVIH